MSSLTLAEYQARTSTTAIYRDACLDLDLAPWIYSAMGLAGEAGEVLNDIKKSIRDGNGEMPVGPGSPTERVEKEIGDVLWYVACLATDLNIDLASVAEKNLAKLADRMARGVIGGSGGNR